jgi:hypothetical protein
MAQVTGGSYDSTRYHLCFDLALEYLKKCSDSWAHGDPEEPPTDLVLKEILKIFERERLLRKPW